MAEERTNGAKDEKQVDPKVLAQSVIEVPEALDRGVPIPETSLIFLMGQAADEMTQWGKNPKERDRQLREFISTESMFLSALGIVTARNSAFRWKLEGTDQTVEVVQELLLTANNGEGWEDFISKISIDLYSQDSGAFIEVVRDGRTAESPVIGLNHLDAMRCWHTGDPRKPVIYQDRKSRFHLLDWFNVITLAELPTAVEGLYGLQYCALSRLLLAAQIIKNISIYKKEKTGGRHNRAIHLVSGVTSKQIEAALAQYRVYNDAAGLQRYTNPVIVGSPDPDANLQLVTLELASLPDGFNEETTFKHYVTQIAMAFFSDYQEFAPLPGGNLGTSTQSEVLHMKGRGKGPAIFQSMITRALNFRVLPRNVIFKFEEQDLEAEETQAKIGRIRAEERKIRIESEEITTEEARQMAADDGDLPQEMLEATAQDVTPIVMATGDIPVTEKEDEGVPIPELEEEKQRKAPKAEVEYRVSTGAQTCGNCLFFQRPSACQVVRGRIRPVDVCNLWAAGDVKQEGPRAGPFDLERLQAEARFNRSVRQAFRRIEKNVVKKLRSESRKEVKQISSVPEDFEFWAMQQNELLEAIGGQTELLLMEGVDQAQRLGLAIDFDLVNEQVLAHAGRTKLEFVQGVTRTTRNSLRTAIQAHVTSGDPLRVLEKKIQPLFGATRAQAIASTEVTRLYADGNAIAYQDAGVAEVEFQTVGDAAVDPDCDALHGERFPVNATGNRPPIHTRCRCWIAPVVCTGTRGSKQEVCAPILKIPEEESIMERVTGGTVEERAVVQETLGAFPNKMGVKKTLRSMDISTTGGLPGASTSSSEVTIQLYRPFTQDKVRLLEAAKVNAVQLPRVAAHETWHAILQAEAPGVAKALNQELLTLYKTYEQKGLKLGMQAGRQTTGYEAQSAVEKAYAKMRGSKPVSQYALSSPNEYAAETIAHFITNPELLKKLDSEAFSIVSKAFGV